MEWTIRTTLDWTIEHFEKTSEENPRLVAQILLAHATGLSRLELYLDYERPLSEAERGRLRENIKRRDLGEPLQYIVGYTYFRKLRLSVRPGVLIPRPETETLIQLVLDELKESQQQGNINILDIGIGSGCIALSLLQELPRCKVTATDISKVAIELTQENANALDLQENLRLVQDDLASSMLVYEQASFDVVISNPPYIPHDELGALPQEVVKFEPHDALDGGADGLEVYRRILEQARILLKPHGLLACELHETNLDTAAALAENEGFNAPTVCNDLTGRPRFILARQQ